MKKLYGVITAMTTPFTAEGKVDVAALEEQTEFLIARASTVCILVVPPVRCIICQPKRENWWQRPW